MRRPVAQTLTICLAGRPERNGALDNPIVDERSATLPRTSWIGLGYRAGLLEMLGWAAGGPES